MKREKPGVMVIVPEYVVYSQVPTTVSVHFMLTRVLTLDESHSDLVIVFSQMSFSISQATEQIYLRIKCHFLSFVFVLRKMLGEHLFTLRKKFRHDF